jgi:ligand-binding SRPBCC domain-containing protein
MREFRNEQEQTIDRGIDEVFPFFADPQNLPLFIPDWISFGMVRPRPVTMARGVLIDYAVRLHGIPFGWRSEITAWDPPHHFVDEQRKGPYRYWIHSHTFEAVSASRTIVRDDVRYAVPGGSLVHKLVVERDLNRIFSHRRQQVEKLFAEGGPAVRGTPAPLSRAASVAPLRIGSDRQVSS